MAIRLSGQTKYRSPSKSPLAMSSGKKNLPSLSSWAHPRRAYDCRRRLFTCGISSDYLEKPPRSYLAILSIRSEDKLFRYMRVAAVELDVDIAFEDPTDIFDLPQSMSAGSERKGK